MQAEGNRTKRTNIATGAVTEYTWDYRDRLTCVTERAGGVGTAATKVTEYRYDVFSRRVAKDVDFGHRPVPHERERVRQRRRAPLTGSVEHLVSGTSRRFYDCL